LIVKLESYRTADPKEYLTFRNQWQDRIHPVLAGRLAYFALLKGKKIIVTSGFRSYEEQINAAENALREHKDYYQADNGAVYNSKGQCMVSAPGNSSHNWGLAIDSAGTWIEDISNDELNKYGLRKPMTYEPWHVEPIETKSMSLDQKKSEFYEYMGVYYPMDVKTFQTITGLKPDNVIGPKTRKKAEEVMDLCKYILNYQTPQQASQESKTLYERQGTTDIVWVDPMALRFAKVNSNGNSLLQKYSSFVNGMFFGNKDGKILTIGTGYSEGKKITERLPWDNVPRGTFIIHKDGRITVEQLIDPEKKYDDIWFCVQGIGLNPIDLKAEWQPENIGRSTIRIMIGYNPEKNKVAITLRPDSDIARGRKTLENLNCMNGNKVLGIGLDSGTPATMVYDGKVIRLADYLDNIIYW